MQSIPIIFEDNNVLIVNKPVGIAMHDVVDENGADQDGVKNTTESDRSGFRTDGIVSILKKQVSLEELHLCHRLDTGTSGCLCLAKNATVAAEIGELFSSRRVSKYYLALSNHKPKKKQGLIVGDMKNRRGGQRILLKTQENPAITQFFSSAAKPGTRGFIIKPHSGKTHQIRVALKSIGAPILGDMLYGGATSDRVYLHSWHMRLPLSSGELAITAPFDTGEVINEEEVQDWYHGLNAPETYPWPSLPARFLLVS
ncbi:RNA pseudouridine synthase [Alteromonas sp. KUL156]|nr:RNA pseudouridine synthase [Alteromonas sp. KUL154]GFD98814.1 RNA pseudouridine synthase [Alteromonas sp. KUL156]